LLPLLFLCGCLEVKDELALNADGSGKVRLEVKSALPAEMLGALGIGPPTDEASSPATYPPLNEGQARKLFPGKDFTVTVKEQGGQDGGRTVLAEAAFKDVNALLNSPYARAHSLTLTVAGGTLTFRAVSGVEAAARLAESEAGAEEFGLPSPERLAELRKKTERMRAEFRVTLPNAVTSTNGAREGKTVSWTLERAKFADTAGFALHAGAVLEAQCGAGGVRMAPVNLPRLGLPFSELPSGAVAGQTGAPDARKVSEAARFEPHALHVKRVMDFNGNGGAAYQNQAQLFGAVVLPRELSPQKWGEAQLEEALDSQGRSLKLSPGQGVSGWSSQSGLPGRLEARAAENQELRHPVTLRFAPPEWKENELARIKGTITLHYFGGSRVVKLTNAVPAKWIVEAGESGEEEFGADERKLQSPELAELGLAVEVQGFAHGPTTTLMLGIEGKQVGITEAQAFDVTGRPWPTLLQQEQEGGEAPCSIVVAGRPQPPLSLALLVSGGGAAVEVPILLENVKVVDPPAVAHAVERPPGSDAATEPPVVEAGPGFVAEPVAVTISTAKYFSGGEKLLRPEALHQLRDTGVVVRVELFAPRGRVIRAVNGARVLKATDNKGRPVTAAGEGMDSNVTHHFDGQQARASTEIQLRLQTPVPDAASIEELEAEAVAVTVGGWKEFAITNAQASATNEIDLASVLPGAKLTVTKSEFTNRRLTLEARLQGSPAIRELELQCRFPGREQAPSYASDLVPATLGEPATRTLSVNAFLYDAADGPPDTVLVVRRPDEPRRERVKFKLTGLDLF
jgi:hypothetical protein